MSEVKVPVGYKQTEVGVIPEDWEVKNIGSLASIQRGASPRPIDSPIWFERNSNVGWLRISDVSKTNKYLTTTSQNLSELGIANSRFVESGSLVMSICATVGKPIITRKDLCIHDGFVLFRGLDANQDYMYYVLQKLEPEWSNKGQTGSQMNLNTSLINSTAIGIPKSLDEQTAIANALTDTDNLIQSLEKLIAKKEAIKTGTMQQLLTGKTRLPEFATREDGSAKGFKQTELGKIPEDWDVIEFSSLAKPASARVNPKVSGGGDYCIEMEHIAQREGRLIGHTETSENSSIKTIFQSGDILFGKLRSYLRKYWFSNRSGVCSTEIWVLRSDANISFNKFLYYVVQTDRFIETTSEAYGTHMPRADWNVVKYFLVPTPPKPEQTAIATILSDMDAEIQALHDRLDKTKAIKQGMMQQLLTGKVRLVSPDQTDNTTPW